MKTHILLVFDFLICSRVFGQDVENGFCSSESCISDKESDENPNMVLVKGTVSFEPIRSICWKNS